ncbi:L-fucose/L-arabinose isomerase family protein [uncultured Dubosiella sp.]|uniref:L-fucose/L-arabinose isomerase family protein n=1 Tax=uncultured Dubosiella sp. TaxID=1937011 RepID=UPI00272F278E|nr:L-fucose/L-arabinose isomerase family protein [uncultured Dubosiella sp.]
MERKYDLKLGVVGTRRDIFSKEDALKYNGMILERLNELEVDFVDITHINEEGLLFDEKDVDAIVDFLKHEKVDALFFPHCNFGTEDLVAKVAKAVGKPVLLWGPKDEAPLANGARLRDSQCGLFATGKILRRFKVPFSYMSMCRLDDAYFAWRLDNFLRAAQVVKELDGMTILQIGTRPAGFWTVMVNEGELIERFNVRVHPVSLPELKEEMEQVGEAEIDAVAQTMRETMHIDVPETALRSTAALKCAMKRLMDRFGCKAAAIQCWNALQGHIGLFPCVANSLLNDEGYPVVCETDIHGAITSLIVQAATRGEQVPFFADWTVPHPTNENGELLQHCGPWPASLMKEKPRFGAPFAFNYSHPGALHGEIKGGDMSIVRFDGDNGEYRLLMGHAKGIDGPKNQGTYVWIEVENLKKLEAKIVEGPYIHHCVGVHADVLPVLHEALKFIPDLKSDYYDTQDAAMDAVLRGE